jgi:hypothetical protein
MQFWFAKPPTYRRFRPTLAIIVVVFLITWVFLSKFIWLIRNSLFAPHMSSLLRSLNTVSLAVAWLHPTLGRAWMIVDRIVQQSNYPISPDDIQIVLDVITQKGSLGFLPEQFEPLLPLVSQLDGFADDIHSLLWFESEQSYLVVLQNTNESRPNGWFFGSFALVRIYQWLPTYIEILDSYLPDFDRPNTYITWPERFNNFLPHRQIHFIGANKVWFTYHDWAHIKALYEKSYPWQRIRGVIFLTTDMFDLLLDDFNEQMWEWQFANAAIDLIRWESRWGKKEHYLQWSQEYFEDNKTTILTWLIRSIDHILAQHRINLYLVDISWPLHGFIRRNNLTTRFESDRMYIWESNISFNKIDNFVEKTVWCFDVVWNDILHATNMHILSFEQFTSGAYTCKISYELAVPEEHFARIARLEALYEIQLTERERHILWVLPNRDTRTIIHLPQHALITAITGDLYDQEIFSTPFSSAWMFKTFIWQNNWSAHVFVSFLIE